MIRPFDRYLERINKKRFLILGGTGFFGQSLIEELTKTITIHNLATQIIITTRNTAQARALGGCFLHPSVTLTEADFSHQDTLVTTWDANYVLHMATTSARDTYMRVAQGSKFNLLINATQAVCKQIATAPPDRVLFTSSGVVYGSRMPVGGFREQTPVSIDHLQAINSLAMGKLAAEHLLAVSCCGSKVPLSIARCFSFVGPSLPTDIHYAIGNFVQDAVLGHPIAVHGDGLDVRSYMHISDAIVWLCHLLFDPNPPPIMNVGSPQPLSIRELAQLVADTVNPGITVQCLNNNPIADNERRREYWPNTDLANSRGLYFTRDLSSSLLELAQTLKVSP